MHSSLKWCPPPPIGIGTVLKWLQSYKLRKSISRQNGTFRILHHNLFHIKVQFTLFIENHLALLTSHSSRIKGKHRCALQERHAVTLYRLPSFNIHSHAHTQFISCPFRGGASVLARILKVLIFIPVPGNTFLTLVISRTNPYLEGGKWLNIQ